MQIFVVGSGRSGTHMLGHLLDSHGCISSTIEKNPAFRLVKWIVIRGHDNIRNRRRLVKLYEAYSVQALPMHYMDKSHPNLWLCEYLASAFPWSKFIGIIRGPRQTVASMLRHPGVLKWQTGMTSLFVSRRFLGITPEIGRGYWRLTPVQRAVCRWAAHVKEARRLAEALPDRFMLVTYEDLVLKTDREVNRIFGFLGLDPPPEHLDISDASLYKWRSVLTDEDMKQIASLMGCLGIRYDEV